MLTREMANKRARLGAAFLDSRKPGWADQVNLDELELSSCHDCVLGQLFGNYCRAYDRFAPDFDPDDSWARDHGFDLSLAQIDPEMTGFSHLNAAWRAEILARVGHPAETEAEAREAQDRAVMEQAGYVACLRPEAIGPERRARVIGSILAMAKGGGR